MIRKKVILITGPTASGKSAMALSLAISLHTQIISADSRQCFREMNIGTAKPSPDELSAVKHYFIDSHSIYDPVNAGTFRTYALDAVREIFRNNDVAIMVGGTGLYIKAFCEGLDEIPAISAELRDEITKQYNQNGLEWLQSEVAAQDPVYYQDGEIKNPQRLMRALEIKLATGRSIKEFQRKTNVEHDFDVVKYATDVPRQQLYENINGRVDTMMQNGLLEEVHSLLPHRQLNALQTVGYTELFNFFDEKISIEAAVEQIKINTRQYAKRQLTWFRRDTAIQWITSEKEIRI